MGRLARLPIGPAIIDFLGHMRADPRLRRSFQGIDFRTAVGLGPGLDTAAVALPALARFGFGFFEVGPVTVEGCKSRPSLARLPDQQAIWFPEPPESLSLRAIRPIVAEASRLGLPLIVRLGYRAEATSQEATNECEQILRQEAPQVQMLSLLTLPLALSGSWSLEQWESHVRAILAAAASAKEPHPVLLCVPADLETAKIEPLIDVALTAGIAGLIVDGSVPAVPNGRLIGLPAQKSALDRVRHLRRRYGNRILLIGSGGVHEPGDALAMRAAGADLVEVDSGMVYSGPGLPKRINEALLFEECRTIPAANRFERPAETTWFWTALMGGGMLFGSVLALAIAATRVVLPYDEAFVGMSRHELAAINPRLLPFMTHDRVSLAGTMVAIGVMYVGLSLFEVRRGLHWAQQSIFVSAFTGFASFFLFLGFGYLDTFHAFVTAALLQLLLLAVHCRLGTYIPAVRPSLQSDRAWRRSLWGQLLLIVHGFALLSAGVAISTIGITRVFVPEDLAFMQTTAEALQAANPRLVPLVAHDRTTFGGMLLAAGWVFLLPALWGFRNGSPGLWWTLFCAGLSAYAAAIGVHYAVGYTTPMHLMPAYVGLGIFLLGMALSHSYLCRTGASP
jgi:dihydroorotate dehydrogenase